MDPKKIEAIILSEKNTSEFPKLADELKNNGVSHFDYIVKDGVYRFYDGPDSFIELKINGQPKPVNPTPDEAMIKNAVADAKAGKLNFEQFCTAAGESGIAYWQVDLIGMITKYMTFSNEVVLTEPF